MSTNDGCCITYKQISIDCDASKCQFQTPSCRYCEDLVSYPIDECCATYECKCNPSLCPELGNLPCPIGCVRIVLDTDECCAVGKCLKNPSINVAANANTFADIMSEGLLTTFTSGHSNGNQVKLNLSKKLKAESAAAVSGLLRVMAETAVCIDESGRERKYGDCWYENKGTCKSCTCYDASDIR